MPDVFHGLVDAVRSAINMAHVALNVSRLNAGKIAEIERRLQCLEAQVDSLLADYEEEKRRARGRAISAGIWRARAEGLKAELDQVSARLARADENSQLTRVPIKLGVRPCGR